MRSIIIMLALVFVLGCGKAPENSENTDSAAKVDLKEPAVKEPFVARWAKKELDPGFARQSITLKPTGFFSLVWSDEQKKTTNKAGSWKNITAQKIELSHELPGGGVEKFTAVLLDPETLEVELNGKKAPYVRARAPENTGLPPIPQPTDPQNLEATDNPRLKELSQRSRFTLASWRREELDKRTTYSLQLNDDGRATFETHSLQGGLVRTEAFWELVTESTIKFRRRTAVGAPLEDYATGELDDENTLRVTIAGEQSLYTNHRGKKKK